MAALRPVPDLPKLPRDAIQSGKLDQVPLPRALTRACRNFEEAAGGREELVAHLAHAPTDKRQELLIGAIADPSNDELSLARICQVYEIPFSSLIQLFRDGGFAKAQVEAMQRVWKLVPDLAEDVMTRALPHLARCLTCKGSGKESMAAEAPSCLECQGKGEIVVQPEREQQKLALQLSGLITPAGAATVVNVNQRTQVGVQVNAGGEGEASVFTRFAAASDKVLYPEAPHSVEVLDAEVVGGGEAGEAGGATAVAQVEGGAEGDLLEAAEVPPVVLGEV